MAHNDDHLSLLNMSATGTSPAQEALQSNLKQKEELVRKGSWYDAARGLVHKSALHAKGFVDTLRRENPKAEQTNEAKNLSVLTLSRNSDESPVIVKTNNASELSKTERHGRASWRRAISFTSRGTRSTSRHLDLLSASGHQRHRSLSKLYGRRRSCDLISAEGRGEGVDSHDTLGPDGAVATPARHSSIATSLVGSIRGFGRRAVSSNLISSISNLSSPTKWSVDIPLPSSPIDIPLAASSLALRLDLGPAAFLPDDFASPPKNDQNHYESSSSSHEMPSSCREDITTTCGPLDDPFVSRSGRIVRPVAPGELLSLPSEAFDFVNPTFESPMPGTTLGLELEDEESDGGNVFERAVESSPATEGKTARALRTMSSLDALTNACTEDEALNSPGFLTAEHIVLHSQLDLSDIDSQPMYSETGREEPSMLDPFVSGDRQFAGVSSFIRRDSALASDNSKIAKNGSVSLLAPKHAQTNDIQASGFSPRGVTDAPSEGNQCVLDAGEYGHFKTDFIFGDLRRAKSPIYDGGQSASPPATIHLTHQRSTASLCPQMYQRISSSNSSSPRSTRAGTTHGADIGDLFWTSSVLDRQAELASRAELDAQGPSRRLGREIQADDQIRAAAFPKGQSDTSDFRSAKTDENKNNHKDAQAGIPDEWSPLSDRNRFARPLPLRLKNRVVSNTSRFEAGSRRSSTADSAADEGDVFSDAQASEFDHEIEHCEDTQSRPSSRPTSRQYVFRPFPPIM